MIQHSKSHLRMTICDENAELGRLADVFLSFSFRQGVSCGSASLV